MCIFQCFLNVADPRSLLLPIRLFSTSPPWVTTTGRGPIAGRSEVRGQGRHKKENKTVHVLFNRVELIYGRSLFLLFFFSYTCIIIILEKKLWKSKTIVTNIIESNTFVIHVV